MGFVAPRLVRRLTARRVISVGAVANVLAFGGIALFHDETWHISALMVLQGLGIGCVVSSLAGVVLALGAAAPDRRRQRHERQHPADRRARSARR